MAIFLCMGVLIWLWGVPVWNRCVYLCADRITRCAGECVYLCADSITRCAGECVCVLTVLRGVLVSVSVCADSITRCAGECVYVCADSITRCAGECVCVCWQYYEVCWWVCVCWQYCEVCWWVCLCALTVLRGVLVSVSVCADSTMRCAVECVCVCWQYYGVCWWVCLCVLTVLWGVLLSVCVCWQYYGVCWWVCLCVLTGLPVLVRPAQAGAACRRALPNARVGRRSMERVSAGPRSAGLAAVRACRHNGQWPIQLQQIPTDASEPVVVHTHACAAGVVFQTL